MTITSEVQHLRPSEIILGINEPIRGNIMVDWACQQLQNNVDATRKLRNHLITYWERTRRYPFAEMVSLQPKSLYAAADKIVERMIQNNDVLPQSFDSINLGLTQKNINEIVDDQISALFPTSKWKKTPKASIANATVLLFTQLLITRGTGDASFFHRLGIDMNSRDSIKPDIPLSAIDYWLQGKI